MNTITYEILIPIIQNEIWDANTVTVRFKATGHLKATVVSSTVESDKFTITRSENKFQIFNSILIKWFNFQENKRQIKPVGLPLHLKKQGVVKAFETIQHLFKYDDVTKSWRAVDSAFV